MIRDFIEKTLGKVFATHAREPDPARMSRTERREAQEVMQPSGHSMRDEPVDDSHAALHEAHAAMEDSPPMEAPYVDESDTARLQGRHASEESGSYLQSDLVDESESAARDAVQSNPHEPPKDEPAEDNETAREDIERVNRKTEGGNAWQRRKTWPV